MSIIRVNKTRDYTVMSNTHLKDKALSLKAKGLLSLMLSLPDDWNYSINGLVSICKDGERAVKGALDELKQNNYVVVTKLFANETQTGRIEYIYDIYESPVNQEVNINKIQGVRFVGVENVALQNVGQLNTKNKITKNKEKASKKKSKNLNNFEQRKYTSEQLNDLLVNMGGLEEKGICAEK